MTYEVGVTESGTSVSEQQQSGKIDLTRRSQRSRSRRVKQVQTLVFGEKVFPEGNT